MMKRYLLAGFGAVLILIGFLGLKTNATSLQMMPLVISTPSQQNLDVPFFTHDAQYLYLNPEGLCRFASKEMILTYWKNKGYYSHAVPSQYTLFVEEAHADYNETRYVESYTSRGFYVVSHKAWNIQWASYTNNYESRLEGEAFHNTYFMKLYLSSGIPLEAAVAVNEDGWATPTGFPLPNHVIIITGYDQNGFYYNNPISLNLSKPSCGANKFISYSDFEDGLTNHLWWFNAVFPINYKQVCTTITVNVAKDTIIHTSQWGSHKSNGSPLQFSSLKTGCLILLDSDNFRHNQRVYGSWSIAYYYGSYIVHPEVTNDIKYSVSSNYAPLTPATQLPIPEPKPTSPLDPSYPYEPIPISEPIESKSNAQLMWYGFIAIGFLVIFISLKVNGGMKF